MSNRAGAIRNRLNATTVVCALLMLACGKTRNVIDAAPPATGGNGGSAGADTADAAGKGGAVAGRGGAGGSSGTAEQIPGVLTWDPNECHVEPVPEPTDPALKERWSLARAYCLARAKQGCLAAGAVEGVPGCTVDQSVEYCVSETLWYGQSAPSECADAWRKDLQCAAKSTFDALCAGTDPLSDSYGGAECAQENAALLECKRKQYAEVEVPGSYATCSYAPASSADATCSVTCKVGPYRADLSCSGPEGLPKQCGCWINGHVVYARDPTFVSDCAQAAEQAAEGWCTGKLDCCFAYQDHDKEVCRCEYPSDFGYDSCETMMAVAQGRRVDICPALLPDDGEGCWPPGACPGH